MSMLPAPTPGFVTGMPDDLYHQTAGASAHRIADMLVSPAHCWTGMQTHTTPTKAMLDGRAAHCCLFEPDLFAATYIARPGDIDRRTKDGKARWSEMVAQYGEGNIIDADVMAMCLGIRESVMAHPKASRLIEAAQHFERSAWWDDPATDVRCKLRADAATDADGLSTIIDLKTCQQGMARPDPFMRSVFSFGYHRQARHYLNGHAALGEGYEHFVLIAAEKEPPYAVKLYRIDDDALDAGQQELTRALERWAECETTGRWPGYDEDVTDISLPAWAWRQIEAA